MNGAVRPVISCERSATGPAGRGGPLVVDVGLARVVVSVDWLVEPAPLPLPLEQLVANTNASRTAAASSDRNMEAGRFVNGVSRSLSSKRRHRLQLPEVVEATGVELADLARVVVGDVVDRISEDLPALGPVGVVVREVALPHQLVEPDEVPVDHRVAIGDHADPEVLREDLGRQPTAVDALITASLPRVIEALERVGDPTGATFGQCDLAIGMRLECSREDEIAERAHRVDATQRDA